MASNIVLINNTIRCEIVGEDVTTLQRMQNVIHVLSTNPFPTLTEVQDLVAIVSGWVASQYFRCYSINIATVEIYARSIAEDPAPFHVQNVNVLGQLTGDMLPPQDTCHVMLSTGTTGRSQMGGFNVFPAAESNQVGGKFLTGYLTLVDTAMGQLLSDIAAGGMSWAVASPTTVDSDAITGYVSRQRVATLRSRDNT